MPAAPTLPTSLIAGSTGHISNSNTVHTVVNSIYQATIGTTKLSAYTLVAADSGSVIPVNSAGSVAISVSGSGMPVGSSIELVQMGGGTITLTTINGAVLTIPSGGTAQPRVQGSAMSLLWLTATSVLVGGDIT